MGVEYVNSCSILPNAMDSSLSFHFQVILFESSRKKGSRLGNSRSSYVQKFCSGKFSPMIRFGAILLSDAWHHEPDFLDFGLLALYQLPFASE